MADIELVIKIDEDIYNHIKERYMYSYATACTTELNKVGFAVRNGIPLPKEHGDLIDRDELLNILEKLEWIRANCSVDEDNTNILEDIIGEVSTIIEADKGE